MSAALGLGLESVPILLCPYENVMWAPQGVFYIPDESIDVFDDYLFDHLGIDPEGHIRDGGGILLDPGPVGRGVYVVTDRRPVEEEIYVHHHTTEYSWEDFERELAADESSMVPPLLSSGRLEDFLAFHEAIIGMRVWGSMGYKDLRKGQKKY